MSPSRSVHICAHLRTGSTRGGCTSGVESVPVASGCCYWQTWVFLQGTRPVSWYNIRSTAKIGLPADHSEDILVMAPARSDVICAFSRAMLGTACAAARAVAPSRPQCPPPSHSYVYAAPFSAPPVRRNLRPVSLILIPSPYAHLSSTQAPPSKSFGFCCASNR